MPWQLVRPGFRLYKLLCSITFLGLCTLGIMSSDSTTTSLVPFTNANPYADAFKLPERRLLIGGKSVTIKQSWEERSETDLE